MTMSSKKRSAGQLSRLSFDCNTLIDQLNKTDSILHWWQIQNGVGVNPNSPKAHEVLR